jgi:protein-tyrosine phosphatase
MRQVPGYSLWLGHVGDFRDLSRILSSEIAALVDLAVNEPPLTFTRELVYLRFPLVDNSGNPPWLLQSAIEAVAQLLRSRTPTLVFCAQGLSRTPCIAAAAISRLRGCSPSDALTIVAQAGPADVSPGLWSDIVATLDQRP